MEKFSVKRPFTVLVAVLVVIILGFVSVSNMTTDLLPSMNLPYMIVITPYPGASPERVEQAVSEPMERALGTISHVKNVYSVSAENYSLTELEFEDGTDMDSAMVKVSSAVEQTRGSLPDMAGTPSILEISMDMIATMYLAVSREGYDIYELSEYINNELVPYFERQEGVASVTTIGVVEKSVQVELNEQKINDLNDEILAKTNEGLREAKAQLDDAKAQVADGQSELEAQEKRFGSMVADGLMGELEPQAVQVKFDLQVQIIDLIKQIDSLQAKLDEMGSPMDSMTYNISGAMANFQEAYKIAGEDLKKARDQLERAQSGATGVIRDGVNSVKQTEGSYQELSDRLDEIEQAIGAITDDVGEAIREAQNPGEDGSGDAGGEEEPGEENEEGGSPESEAGESDGTLPESDSISPSSTEIPADAASEPVSPESIGEEGAAAVHTAAGRQVLLSSPAQNITGHHVLLDEDEPISFELPEAIDSDLERLNDAAQALGEAIENASESTQATVDYFTAEQTRNRLTASVRNLQSAAQTIQNSGSISSISAGITQLVAVAATIQSIMDELNAAYPDAQVKNGVGEVEYELAKLYQEMDRVPELMDGLESGISGLTQGQLDATLGFMQASSGLTQVQQYLQQATAQYEAARTQALKSANIDQLVTAQVLSQLIYAQNFSMPAGYIDDENDNSWLLKIGDEYGSDTDIANALLADVEGIGTIRLSDVADITVIDNADLSYAKLNGDDSIVLSIYKGSTSGTSVVSQNCQKAIRQLMEDDPSIHVVTMMDQGSYISLIVKDILTSMLLGALLAVLVLALFLRDIRPTLMVGISIPLSVLFTLVLMYFSDLSLNIMTLSGLSLGIGMLVDNSIVVMENIIRLRQRGVAPARAAVQGAKQVSNSIVASTLTTICVFLPMIFTTGTVHELLVPMAMSITYCLTASLVVAMTVVPSSASVILRTTKEKKEGVFDRILDRYGDLLHWCLDHKAVPLLGSVALLAVCILWLVRMGIIMLPDMTSDNIEITIVTPEEDDRETSYQKVDAVIERILSVSGVEDVGAMDQGSSLGLISSFTASSEVFGSYICYVTPEEGTSGKAVRALCDEIAAATEGMDCEVTVSAGGMSDLTSFMSSGLSVNIYGQDLERDTEISERVMEAAQRIDGFENVSNGTENDELALHLNIDKDKAMSYGLTVAQIYAQIAARMQTDVTSTTITSDGITLNVVIRDETDLLTRENLLDMEFEEASLGGSSSGMSMAGGSGGMDLSAFSSGDSMDLEEMFAQMLGQGTDAASGEDDDTEGAGESSGASDEAKEESTTHRLGEFATLEETTSPGSINRENQRRYMTVTADTAEGYNTTLLSRAMEEDLKEINASLPDGYSASIGGETTQVREMITQMSKMLALALAFIYLVMVAQFQSLLSPFIILFTVPLAFTGGMLGLIFTGQQLSLLSMMGFLVLMGTVVNNGIVFVDYTNQLRTGGLSRRDALIATGKTRMRPILMTTLTTVLAMGKMLFGDGMGSQLSRGMAIVITGGLVYATLMTLFIVPVVYDILFKRNPMSVEVGDDIDDIPDDAAEYLAAQKARQDAGEDEPCPQQDEAGRALDDGFEEIDL